jgi:hypothetical protein
MENQNWGMWRPEEGHLASKAETANEITCNYVWDKL